MTKRKRECINMAKTGKPEFITKLAEISEITKKEAGIRLEQFQAAVEQSVAEVGDKLDLRGFIAVEKKMAAARKGHNPQTGEAIDIPAKPRTTAKVKF